MIHLVSKPIRGSSISANETCRADKDSTQLPQQQSGQCRLAPGSYVTVFGPDPSSGGLLPTPSRHTRSALGLTLEHPIGSESLKFGDGLIFVVGFTGANETDWSESRLNCPPSTSVSTTNCVLHRQGGCLISKPLLGHNVACPYQNEDTLYAAQAGWRRGVLKPRLWHIDLSLFRNMGVHDICDEHGILQRCQKRRSNRAQRSLVLDLAQRDRITWRPIMSRGCSGPRIFDAPGLVDVKTIFSFRLEESGSNRNRAGL
ncbi:uncharacterized protein CIMG_13541 [Coccidioides immitis RS]|uniref:Uncharacterized protein n=1 Tax=Coccidioides immitis (strain RS) TaxID=246410 RepID=A0A0D8JVX2_COCIM|nr:uncharacterized protein CIMG_13541 [Coccidioides immitis RS]KJF61254.1 hypothetical protein CIMG_13541 [Coccidioides immitis RS]